MVNCCKVSFNILTTIMLLMGVVLAAIGFMGPTLHNTEDKKYTDDGTQKYNTQLKVALFGVAIVGVALVGLAVCGIFAVNCHIKLLLVIFYIVLIIIAVLLLILAGLAFAAVYLRTTAFKDFWKPKMAKYDPIGKIDEDFIEVHGLQVKLPCCGLSDEDVYLEHKELPFSCCSSDKDTKISALFSRILSKGSLNPSTFDTDILKKKLQELEYHLKELQMNLFGSCTREKAKELNRAGCDVAKSEDFILMGKVIAYVSVFVALYLIAVVIMACCIKQRYY